MVAIRDVVDLRVYQRAIKLYPEVVEFVNLIPDKFYKTKHQLLNSSVAIAPLIAEGYSKKRNENEFKRFLEMAMAESDEMVTHMRIVESILQFCPRVSKGKCDYFIEEYRLEAKELQNLKKKWNKYPVQHSV
jgi:four helix bundle protein